MGPVDTPPRAPRSTRRCCLLATLIVLMIALALSRVVFTLSTHSGPASGFGMARRWWLSSMSRPRGHPASGADDGEVPGDGEDVEALSEAEAAAVAEADLALDADAAGAPSVRAPKVRAPKARAAARPDFFAVVISDPPLRMDLF